MSTKDNQSKTKGGRGAKKTADKASADKTEKAPVEKVEKKDDEPKDQGAVEKAPEKDEKTVVDETTEATERPPPRVAECVACKAPSAIIKGRPAQLCPGCFDKFAKDATCVKFKMGVRCSNKKAEEESLCAFCLQARTEKMKGRRGFSGGRGGGRGGNGRSGGGGGTGYRGPREGGRGGGGGANGFRRGGGGGRFGTRGMASANFHGESL
ncbi:MAG: hypothetical protein Edafosvirus15_12 [Edafosvirus sp.]|uniref:Uncharacterized protein n=1 Tax=Edafosvirus sp. TaxID=2487765 RepID=A0A3G4ZWX2_9VIRU|nr:MAG: hypothetical protein Edafosvirus15_12 [Edafosvirus sp.]